MKNVTKPLSKSVLIPLAIHKEMFGSSTPSLDLAKWTTLIIFNEEGNDIMKIVKSLKASALSLKGAIKNELKEQKGGFLSMVLGTLGAGVLRNFLTGKSTIRAGEGTIRVGFLMPSYLLMVFIQETMYLN